MKSILLLTNLQLKLARRMKLFDIKSNVGVTIFNAVSSIVFLALIGGAMYVLKELYFLEKFNRTLLPILIALYVIGIFMFSNSKLVTYFFRSKDSNLIARLPVNHYQVCTSKILTVLIQTCIFYQIRERHNHRRWYVKYTKRLG